MLRLIGFFGLLLALLLFFPSPALAFNNTFLGDDGEFHPVSAGSSGSSNFIDPTASAYGAKCDGITDDRAALQAAGVAAIAAGIPLYIPYSVNGCLVKQDGVNPWCLHFTSPIQIIGGPGYGIIVPDVSVPDSASIVYLVGNGNSYQRAVIAGVMIANPSSGTRHGNHALVFDTLGTNQLFLRPIIRDNYLQSPVSSGGFSVYVTNSAANNSNGGFAYGRFIHNFLGSGVSLNSAGDSIEFIANNLSGSTTNDGVYANLVTGAGNLQVIGNNCGINATCVHIDCSTTFDISSNELEHNNAGSTNAIINIAGAVCSIPGGTITNNELTVIQGTGVNKPLAVALGTSSGIVVDANRIATYTAYTPFTIAAASSQTHVGCNNYFVTVNGLTTLTDSSTTTIYCKAQRYVGHTLHSATCATNTTCAFLNDIQAGGSYVFVYDRTPTDGLFKNFAVYFGDGAPGASASYIVTLRKNSANAAITCTISGAGTNSCTDTTHTVTAVTGDQWNFSVVDSNGAAVAQDIQWSIEFNPYTQ